MHIQRIYIGGWFQRTALHLSEIHDFLANGTSSLALDPKKLADLRQKLGLRHVERRLDGLEYLAVETESEIVLRVYEDGLIVLCKDTEKEAGDPTETAMPLLREYYENTLSPAFSYLFSLGAPVPKELANIKTIFPYFMVLQDASREEVSALLQKFQQTPRFEAVGDGFELSRGSTVHIINHKTQSNESVERFIEEQIFLREFKAQLHRYLNIHRIIWEHIAEVKERGTIVGREIGAFRTKIEGYAKTINLIDARIHQMGSYLSTRERIAGKDKRLEAFAGVLDYRYESLRDTLSYIGDIWTMTKNYVSSAKDLFSSLESQATSNSVRNLTVVTSMGVGATLIGLFTTASAPKFTTFGVGYFVVLAAIGYSADRLTKWFYRRKSYGVSGQDYDKNIA